MRGAVTFDSSALTAGTTTTIVGDFQINGSVVTSGAGSITLSDDGLANFRRLINSIARGRHERVTG